MLPSPTHSDPITSPRSGEAELRAGLCLGTGESVPCISSCSPAGSVSPARFLLLFADPGWTCPF